MIEEGLRQRQALGVAAARPFFEQAVRLEPDSYLPLFMLGNVASELRDLDGAVAYYQRARVLAPTNPAVRFNLGSNLLWSGDIGAALDELAAAHSLDPDYLAAQSTWLIALHYSDRVEPETIAAATRQWGAHFASRHPANPRRPPGPADAAPRRLRVGFVSGDFRTHSVAHFLEPIASGHDRDAFEFAFYSTLSQPDAVTARLRTAADLWRDVATLSDDALLAQIGDDRIDLLVDLSGHTRDNRLAVFARRAAPVQIGYLGYPDSTGLPTMDYRITDATTDPAPSADGWHGERLLRLPGVQWCFRPFGAPPDPSPLPAEHNGYVTFGSFNDLTKASETILRCWAQLLLRLPTARLRLTRIRSPRRAQAVLDWFGAAGVEASRIECVPYHTEVPHGHQFAGVDIALDPYPYNGVTTTCESLYLGVPVISLHGRHGASRSGLSLLGAVGLRDLVAASAEHYVEIGVKLAGDLARLAHLRATLRARLDASSLRDEARFVVHFEDLLREAWQRYLAGEGAA